MLLFSFHNVVQHAMLFYVHLQVMVEVEVHNSSNNTNSTNIGLPGSTGNLTCLQPYKGHHCLKSLQNCIGSGSESDVFVSNAVVDQISTEQYLGDLIFSFELFIQPSEECRSSVIPFLCLYTFGVCGANNDDYRPTAAQCMEIRDSICESE